MLGLPDVVCSLYCLGHSVPTKFIAQAQVVNSRQEQWEYVSTFKLVVYRDCPSLRLLQLTKLMKQMVFVAVRPHVVVPAKLKGACSHVSWLGASFVNLSPFIGQLEAVGLLPI
jgi:hypothetical protein